MLIDCSAPEHERAFFSFGDLLKAKKNLFQELLEKYQPLLAELGDDSINSSAGNALPSSSKDSIKQIFMEGALGGRIKTDKLKLSDFIDEQFFEELDLSSQSDKEMEDPTKKNGGVSSSNFLKDFIQEIKKNSAHSCFMPNQIGQKRIKAQIKSKEEIPAYLMMHPLLAIIM